MRIWFGFWLGCLLLVVVGDVVLKDPWQSWTPDPGPWCERPRTGNFLQEPANSYSDFAFLAVGLNMVRYGLRDYLHRKKHSERWSHQIQAQPWVSWGFGVANVVHFVGTFTNHACRCHFGHRLDAFGMYSVVWVMLAYELCVLLRLSINAPATQSPFLFVAVFGIGETFLWSHADVFYGRQCELRELCTMVMLIGTFFACALGHLRLISRLDRSPQVSYEMPHLQKAVACLAVGFVAHSLDKANILCWPDSPLQGHAIWHIATALALHFAYRFMRSESHVSDK
eukprot:c26738_g1_i1.p1 GENE.c26738_g1_i1~~c26738_g1_i1.p1  ORF type:complete len:283 (+),score=31.81 c26738_g1_i1:34-882(+)